MQFSNTSLSAVLLALLRSVPALARDCFYPDGSLPVPQEGNYVPCGPENGPHSAYCASGDGCSTTGLCFGDAGFMYRGGCTDPYWAAQECAQHCQNVTVHSFSNLYPCPNPPGLSPGLFTRKFCCGAQEGLASGGGCCGVSDFNTTAFGGFGSFLIKAGSASHISQPTSISSSSSSSPATSSSTAGATSPASSVSTAPTQSSAHPREPTTSNHATKIDTEIGVGVGVPLGIILLSGLAFLLYRERKSRMYLEQRFQSLQTSCRDNRRSIKGQDPAPILHELQTWERQPELLSDSRAGIMERL